MLVPSAVSVLQFSDNGIWYLFIPASFLSGLQFFNSNKFFFLGNAENLMRGYHLVFDRENLKLGWSSSNCELNLSSPFSTLYFQDYKWEHMFQSWDFLGSHPTDFVGLENLVVQMTGKPNWPHWSGRSSQSLLWHCLRDPIARITCLPLQIFL